MAPDRQATPLRIVVAVSRDRSDLFFANELMRRVNVVGVIVERQWLDPGAVPRSDRLRRLLSSPLRLPRRLVQAAVFRFRRRFAIYNQPRNLTDFGDFGLELYPVTGCAVLNVDGSSRLNGPECLEWLQRQAPDLVAVCGTSLMNARLLKVPRIGVLNLHGGLSQRYRGLNTTDWAVHNGEPEYVGATVHFVTPGIDDGEIVYQGRPKIERDDSPNDLYVKVVRLGIEMMQAAIRDQENGTLRSTKLEQRGTLYLGRQFTHRARIATWRRYEAGVVGNYLDNRHARDQAVDQVIRNDFCNQRVHADTPATISLEPDGRDSIPS